jgi:hypothetical protein
MAGRAAIARGLDRLSARARADAIPSAELDAFGAVARRTRIVRLALAGLLTLGTVVALLVVPQADERRFQPARNVGIVVLDLSTSVRPSTYELIRRQLEGLAATNRRFGMVVFSDVAYQTIPPATPARELEPYVRFFQPEYRFDEEGNPLPRSPWEQWFSAGTSISSGLLLAAKLLEERTYEQRGVVLISDLADDPSDYQTLADTVSLYSRRQIPLSVVALDPTPEDSEFFTRLLDNPGAIGNVSLPTQQSGRGQLRVAAAFPVATGILAALVIALLALNLHWTEPLQWRRRTV